MIFSLDTTTAVDLLRRRQAHVRDRFEAAKNKGVKLVISTVALHELSYGAMLSERPAAKMADINDLLAQTELVTFEGGDARCAGWLRVELGKAREWIGIPDLFIAAQAVQRNWIVVTSNVRHFGRIQGLPLIDWRISDQPFTPEQIAERLV